jgi:predicted ribonuclease YlaK
MSPTQEQIQGYLPGTQEEKSAVYSEPLIQALITLGINPNVALISDNNLTAQKQGKAYISFMTHTYMRGINIESSVVILDESQNYFKDSLKKVLTRIHDTCKVIVIGHSGQIDIIKHPERSGFEALLELFSRADFAEVVELKENHRGKISLLADEL